MSIPLCRLSVSTIIGVRVVFAMNVSHIFPQSVLAINLDSECD